MTHYVLKKDHSANVLKGINKLEDYKRGDRQDQLRSYCKIQVEMMMIAARKWQKLKRKANEFKSTLGH